MEPMKGTLAQVIHEQNISRNILIRSIPIDRSTFYQILNGKRPGTAEQIAGILSKVEVSPERRQRIIREFAERKFGDGCRLYNEINRWLAKLDAADKRKERTEDAAQGESPCKTRDTACISHTSGTGRAAAEENFARVTGELRSMLLSAGADRTETMRQGGTEGGTKGKASFCLFLPMWLLTYLWTRTDFLELADAAAESRDVRILVEMDLDEQKKLDGKLELLFSYLFGLYHARNFIEIVHGISFRHGDAETPVPYFACSGGSVYLMDRDCSRGIMVQQPDMAEVYRGFFSRMNAKSYEYLERYDSFENFMKALYGRFVENAGPGRENRLAERRICIFKVAGKEQIARYADPSIRDFLLSYRDMFCAINSSFLHSAAALSAFAKKPVLEENGIRVRVDAADAEKIREHALSPERQDILFLAGEEDILPRNWTFALFSTGELMILPNWDYHLIISIRNEEICHAFSAWFEVSREIALVRKKLDIV